MDDGKKFQLVASMMQKLGGPDGGIWYNRFSELELRDDPHRENVPRGNILAIKYRCEIKPPDLIAHLQSKGVTIHPAVIAATERLINEYRKEAGGSNGDFFLDNMMESQQTFVEFAPHLFGAHVEWERASFGQNGRIAYGEILRAAEKYGFPQMNIIDALYFCLAYLDAHKYNAGTHIYVGCKPTMYADNALPIIPGLSYDKDHGSSITPHEVAEKLRMDHGHGQGEHFCHTFVFPMPYKT